MATGLAVFDRTLQITNEWLWELEGTIGTGNRYAAYSALRAVLHALRDRLTVDEAADLSSELPMLIRGIYYEGWRPAAVPVKERTQAGFLAMVATAARESPVAPETAVRAVLRLLANRISSGQFEQMRRMMPGEIRELWPDGPAAGTEGTNASMRTDSDRAA
jgi:uncharacterized protein (DUF2267 family)